MKKVLIITYHFPPDAAIGAVRLAKFTKYLSEFGWEPVVYTLHEKHYERRDYTKLEPALKGIKIHRANLIPGPLEIYSRLTSKAFGSFKAVSHLEVQEPAASSEVGPLKRFVSSMLRVPDGQQGWIANIALDGPRILRQHGIRVVMTSGPPMSTHIGGLFLKHLTQVKWLADFRDPWATATWKDSNQDTALARTLERWMESAVIRSADTVVCTTDSLSEYFRSLLPFNHRSKCFTITNGFDEDDFTKLSPAERQVSHKLRITHAGSLYYNRNPEPFFMALHQLIDRREIDEGRIEIDFLGDCEYYNGVSVPKLIRKYELEQVVNLLGSMSFQACLKHMTNSDALLLFAQGQPWQVPGKVFEYLRLNKPIFAITEEGETCNMLKSFPYAFIADSKSHGAIAKEFLRMLQAIGNKEQLGSAEQIRQYDRRHLVEKLACCLHQADGAGVSRCEARKSTFG